MEDATQQKINALAAHTGTKTEDIKQSDYDDLVFDANGTEYLVFDEEEGNARAREHIRESLWESDADFIIDHSELPDESKEMIMLLQLDKCEDANHAIEAVISDMDEFIEDAISSHGNVHFLNLDNEDEEDEESEFYIYQV